MNGLWTDADMFTIYNRSMWYEGDHTRLGLIFLIITAYKKQCQGGMDDAEMGENKYHDIVIWEKIWS